MLSMAAIYAPAIAQVSGAQPQPGPLYAVIDLNPTTIRGVASSQALSIGGTTVAGFGTTAFGNNPTHALLWTGGAATAVDLTPNGFFGTEALFTSGSQQVGDGMTVGPVNYTHALLWTGSASSAVDLTPTALSWVIDSTAVFTDGVHQLGSGSNLSGTTHALVWSGSGASAIDLGPTNLPWIQQSQANTISGSQIFGWGYGPNPTDPAKLQMHALLWNGFLTGATDLTPTNLTGITDSQILAAGGSQQVGWGSAGTSQYQHALLWTGRPDNVVDLQPDGFFSSVANASNGRQQVGWGDSEAAGGNHALLWTGTAGSVVDLTQFLPVKFVYSMATGIDAEGNIVGTAQDELGVEHAVVWHLPILGDANLDGNVDFADLVTLAQHYNQQSGATWQDGDFDQDGKVNFSDLVILAAHYGQSLNGGQGPANEDLDMPLETNLPEPGICALMVFAALVARRRGPKDD